MSGDIEHEWNSLMTELKSDVFLGPYINKNGLTGRFSPNLVHTGLDLVVATASKKIDVPILHHKRSFWWRARDYVVPVAGVGFSFSHTPSEDAFVDGHQVHRFFHLFGTILKCRKPKGAKLLDLFDVLEPILEHSGGAPLKRNALRTLIPKYAEMGFATAPTKLQKESVAIRILWVYPKFRCPKAISNYLPVATARFPMSADYSLGTGRVDFPWYNETTLGLKQFFRGEDLDNPIRLFSAEGLNELRLPVQSRQSGGHERTKLMGQRLEMVKQMKTAGHEPKEIVMKLRASGLYSLKVPLSQQVYQVESMIERLTCGKS